MKPLHINQNKGVFKLRTQELRKDCVKTFFNDCMLQKENVWW